MTKTYFDCFIRAKVVALLDLLAASWLFKLVSVHLYPAQMRQRPSEYKYEGFLDNESIRMLVLEAGEANELLKVKLEPININDAGSYEPLSYVWGQPGPTDTSDYKVSISADEGERRLEITESLFCALRQLRLRDRPRRIWADQICID